MALMVTGNFPPGKVSRMVRQAPEKYPPGSDNASERNKPDCTDSLSLFEQGIQ